MPMANAAEILKSQGRYGDSELMHVNPAERAQLERERGGFQSINPVTGLPEAWVGMAAAAAAPIALNALSNSPLGKQLGLGPQEQNMQSTQSTQLDPTSQAIKQYGFDQMKGHIDAGFQQYTDPRFATMNTDQTGAMTGIRDTVGTYTGPGGRLDQAYDVASGVGSYNPGTVQAGSFLTGPGIDQYMNPYNQAVIDAGKQDLDDALKLGRQTVGQAAHGANAFGGARHALAEGTMASNAIQDYMQRGDALRQQGFEAAARRKESDMTRAQTASGQNVGYGIQGKGLNLSAVPQMRDQSGYFDAYGQQMGIGDKQFGLDQLQKDFDYGQFQAEQNFIPDMVGKLGAFSGGTGSGSTTTSNTPMYTNPMKENLGLGLAGLGAYGMYKNMS
tara:strand:- start:5139 stop:6302 length:1164 start_codon:yes stop_codon:yes gene_type:complete